MKKILGMFKVTSGKIIVTDPCYKKTYVNDLTDCSHALRAKNGNWVFAQITEQQNSGRQCLINELIAHHADHADSPVGFAPMTVAVDSGQVGVFDLDLYPDDPGDYNDEGSFYRKICDLSELHGGTIESGGVSPTKYGDGSYDLYVGKDEVGEVVSLRVVFDEDDEDEYDEEDEFEDD